jgi:hypothetical protein
VSTQRSLPVRRIRVLPILLVVGGVAGLVGGSAGAGAAAHNSKPVSSVRVGVADEQPSTFGVPAFKALRTRISRYVTPYDVATNHSQNDLPRLREWLAAARRDHIQPLIAFYHSDRTPRRMPSVKAYRADIKRFHRMFPHVGLLQPWNEANRGYVKAGHGSYASPSAKQSASYYQAVRHVCSRCTVVGLDVLDSTDVKATIRYINQFKRALGHSRRPTIWGLHNYSDTNRFRSTGTRAVLAHTSGQVWLTETGGIAKLSSSFPFSLHRQARATRYMFSLAGISRRITRLYIFQWTGGNAKKERFDAGLTNRAEKPRPAYCVVYKHLRHTRRCPYKTATN